MTPQSAGAASVQWNPELSSWRRIGHEGLGHAVCPSLSHSCSPLLASQVMPLLLKGTAEAVLDAATLLPYTSTTAP